MKAQTPTIQSLVDRLSQDPQQEFSLDQDKLDKRLKAHQENDSPMMVKVFTIIGAWMSALTFTGFLAVIQLFDSQGATIFTGILFITAGLFLSFMQYRKFLFEPLGLALTIIGYVLLPFGIFDFDWEPKGVLWFGVLLQVITLIVSRSAIQKFVSVMLLNLCLIGLVIDSKFHDGMHLIIAANGILLTLLNLKEPTILSQFKWLIPYNSAIRSALMISFLLMLYVFHFNEPYMLDGKVLHVYITTAAIGGLILYALYEITKIEGLEKHRIILFIAFIIVLAPLYKAPGIMAGILILLLGMYNGVRLYIGMGILAIAVYTIEFYYNLHTTLLVKSIMMMVSGILFFLIGIGIKRYALDKTTS